MIVVHTKTTDPVVHPVIFKHQPPTPKYAMRGYKTLAGARRAITRRLNDFSVAGVQWVRLADRDDYMIFRLAVYKEKPNGDPVLAFVGEHRVKIVHLERLRSEGALGTVVNDEYVYTGMHR